MSVFNKYWILLSAVALVLSSCREAAPEKLRDVTLDSGGFSGLAVEFPDVQLGDDTIPDFSMVGYRHGDEIFPDYSNVVNLPAPSAIEGDATQIIQNAIDNAPSGSVIQFAAGHYIVDGMLILDKDGIILRGAGNGDTEIFARGTTALDDVNPAADSVFYPSVRPLVNVGVSNTPRTAEKNLLLISKITIQNMDSRLLEDHPNPWHVRGTGFNSGFKRKVLPGSEIVEDAFCGSRFVTVRDASVFSPGQDVVLFRAATQAWIDDLVMTEYWTASDFSMYWERKITAIVGNRLYFDAPLVMSITREYGGGQVHPCSTTRVTGCGIENLSFISDYNGGRNYLYNGKEVKGDIYHATSAIVFHGAENCWVKDVATKYFCESAVDMTSASKNITVQNCHQYEPAGYITGGLRYGFHISGGQQCLVRECTSDFDRHQFVTGARVPGPNVFLNCSASNAYSDVGPHQRWATGTLYDHVTSDNSIKARNAGASGTGHGWQGVNQVFWSCSAPVHDVQSPTVTGYNYWIDDNPVSLYETQRNKRNQL